MGNFRGTDWQVTTGNFRTAVDLPNPTSASSGFNLVGFPNPFPGSGFPNPLGVEYWDNPVTAANPNGVMTKYRYVQFKATANPAIQTRPAAVWWVDATYTTVTSTLPESLTGTASSFAGIMMVNTTDLSTITAAILNANGGAAIWIAVAGLVTGVASAAAAAGDQLMATQADWTTTGGFSKVADGVAPTHRVAAIANAASPSSVYVMAESL